MPSPDPAGPVLEVPADPGRADEVWVLAEHVKGRTIGERVQLAAAFVTDGSYGLVRLTDSDGKVRPCLVRRLVGSELADFCDERRFSCPDESLEGDEKSAADCC